MRSQILAVQKMQDYIEARLQRRSRWPLWQTFAIFPLGMPTGCFGNIPVTLLRSISVGCGWQSPLCV